MRAYLPATIAVAMLLGVAQSAQVSGQAAGPPATGSVVVKGRAPVSNRMLRVKLPRPAEAEMPNGLHLMVLEDRRAPQVEFSLIIPGAGGYGDPDGMTGLASFTAAMMREGTTTRTSQQISEQLETMTAVFNVGAGPSSLDAFASGSALTEHFDRLMEIAADVLLNPTFADRELALYKQRSRAQLIQQRSSPAFLANELYARVIYGTHPASHISASTEALDKVSRADLQSFHDQRYVPDHAILAIAGDISLSEARKLVDSRLASWKKAGIPALQVSDPPAAPSAGVHVVARANSVQTNFIVGTPAVKRTAPDFDIISVMNRVIGGGPTARLFLNLREEKGYTYGAYSYLSAAQYRGDWRATSDVRAEVTEPALREIMREISRLRDEPIPDKEFRDAKRSMIAQFALSLESPEQVLNYYVTSRRYGLSPDYWDMYPERITAVTQAQVQAAAKKYLDASRVQIVAVTEPKATGVFKTYGTLVVYDTEGRRSGS